jgi:hypothetical protein
MTGALVPSPTGVDLGSTSARWDAFLQEVSVSGTVNAAAYQQSGAALNFSHLAGTAADAQIAATIARDSEINVQVPQCLGMGATVKFVI